MSKAKHVWNVLKKATSFRSAVATYLTAVSAAGASGQPIKHIALYGLLPIIGTVFCKMFDEDLFPELTDGAK